MCQSVLERPGPDDPQKFSSLYTQKREAKGITIVAAAGTENTGTVSFPASLPNVISVGAGDGRWLRARERLSESGQR